MSAGREFLLEHPKWIRWCQFPRTLREPKVLSSADKQSASDAVVVFGALDIADRVVFKIGFQPSPGGDNSLVVEADVYEHIVNPLLMNRVTPYVVAMVGRFDCAYDELAKEAEEAGLGDLVDGLDDLQCRTDPAPCDTTRVIGIITECGGYKLSSVIAGSTAAGCMGAPLAPTVALDESDWLAVLLQMQWTFAVMVLLGVRHNDAHAGNVLVSIEAPTDTLLFLDERTCWRVRSRVRCRLYDFDLAGVDPNGLLRGLKVPRNTRLYEGAGGMCPYYGACDDASPFFDSFLFLSYLSSVTQLPGAAGAAVDEIVSTRLRAMALDTEAARTVFRFPHRLCFPDDDVVPYLVAARLGTVPATQRIATVPSDLARAKNDPDSTMRAVLTRIGHRKLAERARRTRCRTFRADDFDRLGVRRMLTPAEAIARGGPLDRLSRANSIESIRLFSADAGDDLADVVRGVPPDRMFAMPGVRVPSAKTKRKRSGSGRASKSKSRKTRATRTRTAK